MKCPYCGEDAIFGPNEGFYGRRYISAAGSYMAYYCLKDNAYVGTHQNDPKRPLGTMADDKLRKARIAAHTNIDRYWKEKGWPRKKVYAKLQERFGRPIHVGESDLKLAHELAEINLEDGLHLS